MRVRLSGSTITAHGDALGTPYVEFYGNEPVGFPADWTVVGSSPNRLLKDPRGQVVSVELPDQAAPAPSGGSGLPSQWTDGGHGDVTATTDDASVPLTVTGPVVIQPDVAGTVGPLTIHGLSDPMEPGTANLNLRAAPGVDSTHLLDGFGQDGSQTFEVRPNGGVSAFKAPGTGDAIYFQALDASLATIFDVQDASGTTVNAPTAVVTPLNLRGVAGQTAPLIDAISDTGETTLLANGAIRFDATAVADADLYAGSVSLYFDATNGAAKLRIKGKSANGTVVTGTVNLT